MYLYVRLQDATVRYGAVRCRCGAVQVQVPRLFVRRLYFKEEYRQIGEFRGVLCAMGRLGEGYMSKVFTVLSGLGVLGCRQTGR